MTINPCSCGGEVEFKVYHHRMDCRDHPCSIVCSKCNKMMKDFMMDLSERSRYWVIEKWNKLNPTKAKEKAAKKSELQILCEQNKEIIHLLKLIVQHVTPNTTTISETAAATTDG